MGGAKINQRTIQCTEVPGVGARAQQIKPRNSVIVNVLAISRRARAQSRSDGARKRNRNQP